MSNVNIEVLDGNIVHLNTLPSGDLEIRVSGYSPGRDLGKANIRFDRKEIIVATIPKHRRDLVADFIRNAP